MRLNGRLEQSLVLDHPASVWHHPVAKPVPTLHLGHTAHPQERSRLGQYHLGPVLLFASKSDFLSILRTEVAHIERKY